MKTTIKWSYIDLLTLKVLTVIYNGCHNIKRKRNIFISKISKNKDRMIKSKNRISLHYLSIVHVILHVLDISNSTKYMT